ncbi:hypothetical protein ACFWIW_13970 [Amycolatopsis sp. NPDC058340]|uniref:hypothetical protein n=1 Tax=Amycolatopsis sp. NPDC058340 TaxID=3346453 RepID=UPI0036554882
MSSKNNPFNFKTSSGILKKLVITLVVVAIIVMVLKSPGESAELVTDARDNGEGVIDSLITFFRGLAKD